MMHTDDPQTPSTPGFHTPVGSRRTFFRWAIQFCAAVIGIGLAVPLAGYVIAPTLRRKTNPWVAVGEVDSLKPESPTQLEYVTTVQDGWRQSEVRKAVWALKREGGEVTVYSPICPHLGCGFNWDQAGRRFKCPCHGSVYDINGTVLAGPAPRPLDTLPIRLDDGTLLVQYKEYKAGLSKKVEL